MAEEWHSYQEVADALGVQLQAVYKRRKRGGWQQRLITRPARSKSWWT